MSLGRKGLDVAVVGAGCGGICRNCWKFSFEKRDPMPGIFSDV
jgi:hypothetical protein